MGDLRVFSLNEKEKTEFIKTYEQFYFNKESYTYDEKKILNTILRNKTEIDVEMYADRVLNGQEIDKRVFLWKVGRLTSEEANLQGADRIHKIRVVDVRGNEIENAEAFINRALKIKLNNGIDDFEDSYKKLLDIAKEVKLKNVGSVYLITILFFMSQKKYPIYDFFAHRAVKALYLGKKPTEVFVGAAPDKTEKDKVFAMYNEYVFLLEQVFGYHAIDRELDRALWVYGHASKRWDEID